MPKNKEYTEKGAREFYSIKGCHSCFDCTHCLTDLDKENGLSYHCAIKIGKTSRLDLRFPYDNTRCEDFQEQPTKG